jgi:hypothetical protein
MFNGCFSLNKIEVGFTSWKQNITTDWLANVSEEGIFICPEELDNL